MAGSILKSFKLSSNDVSDLSDVLSSEMNVYRQNPQALFSDKYCTWLNLIVGLGFTAVLSDKYNRYQPEYMKYLDSYLKVRKSLPKDFNKGEISIVSESIACMAQLALQAFPYSLNCPRYFDDFIEALRQTICRAILRDSANNSLVNKAYRILDLIDKI